MNQILNKNLKTFLHELVENNSNNMVKPNSSDNQLNNLESLLNFFGINNINNKTISPKANTKNGFVFSQGESGQWYNWANCFGTKYTGISYSAGTTYLFNKSSPLVYPIIKIFDNNQINSEQQSQPLFQLELKEQGIRSMLMIDNCSDPYVLIGTFTYPVKGIVSTCKMIKWNFITNKLTTLFELENTNSIRKILLYKLSKSKKYIVFSTQNDLGLSSSTKSQIFYFNKNKLDNGNFCSYNFKCLEYDCNLITGSVWDISIDSNILYISIPKVSEDSTKLSGFNVRGRLFYCDICKLFDKNSSIVKTHSIIGNSIYPDGFDINSISTFQVETNPETNIVYIYSISDYLYQTQAVNLTNVLSNQISPITTVLEFLILIRTLINNFDIDGSRIFTFNKKDLFNKHPPVISTVIGDSVYNSFNKSKSSNGYNNFANIYTWCSCSIKNYFGFGTLDIRSSLYVSLVYSLATILNLPNLIPFMLGLPEYLIILITEFIFDPDFNFNSNFNYEDKLLYFDAFTINSDTNQVEKITSNGFSSIDGLNPVGDDGCRNINILSNKSGTYLVIGSTCYQNDNVAKVYTVKL